MFASGCFVVPIVIVFGSSDYRASEGLAPFLGSRTLARHFRPTCRPRSLDAKKGTVASTGKSPEPCGKDRPIDQMSGMDTSA
jgi:hypothetical protein